MYILRADYVWVTEHAERGSDSDKVWRCKTTGVNIAADAMPRTLRDGIFPLSGGGEVPAVLHLHCPACNPDWKPPTLGTPVEESELAEAH